jgi:hypothetical protein
LRVEVRKAGSMAVDESLVRTVERWLAPHEERLGALRGHRDGIDRQLRELGDEPTTDVPSTQREKVRAPRPVKPITKEVLERRRALIADEIAAHEALVSLARDRAILETLEDVLKNPDVAIEAAADPRGFARRRRIDLPRSMGVEVRVELDRTTVLIGYRTDTLTIVLELGGDDIE